MIKIVAHRGGMSRGQENAITAFRRAIEDGADAFECDVDLTKDKEPVLIHRRVLGGGFKPDKMIWADIKKLETKSEPMPHLCEMLEFLKACPGRCFLEIKNASPELLAKVIRHVSDFGVADKITLINFYDKRGILIAAKRLNPAFGISVILTNPFSDWIGAGRAAGADIIIPGWKKINHLKIADGFLAGLKPKIAKTKESGFEVYSGIANREKDVQWLMRLGIDGIFTDNVPLARELTAIKHG